MYLTITQSCQFTYEEKRSEFIAYAYPVTQREQLMGHINDLKKQYPDARHYCWAYLIGSPQQPVTAAFNDDGEPAGTAGKPILHVLTQRGAGDTGIVVVRYFGGIKLGAGGLTRAYGQATSKVLDNAVWREVVPQSRITITAPYENEPHIRHFCTQYHGVILAHDYTDCVSLTVQIASNQLTQLSASITQKTAGKAVIKTG